MATQKQLREVSKKEEGNEYLVKTPTCQYVTEIMAILVQTVLSFLFY